MEPVFFSMSNNGEGIRPEKTNTSWQVSASFISLPDNTESWQNLQSHSSYDDALRNACNENEDGVTVRGYHNYRITKNVCTSVEVWCTGYLHDDAP